MACQPCSHDPDCSSKSVPRSLRFSNDGTSQEPLSSPLSGMDHRFPQFLLPLPSYFFTLWPTRPTRSAKREKTADAMENALSVPVPRWLGRPYGSAETSLQVHGRLSGPYQSAPRHLQERGCWPTYGWLVGSTEKKCTPLCSRLCSDREQASR